MYKDEHGDNSVNQKQMQAMVSPVMAQVFILLKSRKPKSCCSTVKSPQTNNQIKGDYIIPNRSWQECHWVVLSLAKAVLLGLNVCKGSKLMGFHIYFLYEYLVGKCWRNFKLDWFHRKEWNHGSYLYTWNEEHFWNHIKYKRDGIK